MRPRATSCDPRTDRSHSAFSDRLIVRPSRRPIPSAFPFSPRSSLGSSAGCTGGCGIWFRHLAGWLAEVSSLYNSHRIMPARFSPGTAP
jgi:hypothetical protein